MMAELTRINLLRSLMLLLAQVGIDRVYDVGKLLQIVQVRDVAHGGCCRSRVTRLRAASVLPADGNLLAIYIQCYRGLHLRWLLLLSELSHVTVERSLRDLARISVQFFVDQTILVFIILGLGSRHSRHKMWIHLDLVPIVVLKLGFFIRAELILGLLRLLQRCLILAISPMPVPVLLLSTTIESNAKLVTACIRKR